MPATSKTSKTSGLATAATPPKGLSYAETRQWYEVNGQAEKSEQMRLSANESSRKSKAQATVKNAQAARDAAVEALAKAEAVLAKAQAALEEAMASTGTADSAVSK